MVFSTIDNKTHFVFIATDYGECFTAVNGVDYRGVVNVTNTGNICQRWTSQFPHMPVYRPENYPLAGLGDHNYCRNPVSEVGPWCYTTDSNVVWEDCDTGVPKSDCDGKFPFKHGQSARRAYDGKGRIT